MPVTNEVQHIVWDGYGLRLKIPRNALPVDCNQFRLKMEVALSGEFQLPKDSVLVSAVYSFSHNLGDKELVCPVTLEMQHCVTTTALSDLSIIRAQLHSNKFDVVPGGNFTSTQGYGIIKLPYFSRFAIALRRIRKLFSPSPSPFEYCAKIYYTKILHLQFNFNFFIIRNLEALSKVCYIDHVCHSTLIVLFC